MRYLQRRQVLDRIISLPALLLILILSPLIAFAVRRSVGAPVVFRQPRVGRHGRAIRVLKLRSMRELTDGSGNSLPDRERTTRLGAFLRARRIDEIPQFWNVLWGEMALIGPRPLMPADQPEDRTVRLSVLPGITGWAQVTGGALLSVEEKNALDEFYVRNASLRLDVLIMLKTIQTIVSGDRTDMPGETSARTALVLQHG